MASHTIKVSGVSAELLGLLDARVKTQHAAGRSEYVRELIRRDVLDPRPATGQSFREIVAPVHAATPAEETEEDVEQFIDELIATVRRERRSKRQQMAEAASP